MFKGFLWRAVSYFRQWKDFPSYSSSSLAIWQDISPLEIDRPDYKVYVELALFKGRQ